MASFIQEILEGKIDFVGQKAAESIMKIVLVVSTIVSFIVGFALQDIRLTFGIMTVTTVVLTLVIVPPWPMLNRYPVRWLPVENVVCS